MYEWASLTDFQRAVEKELEKIGKCTMDKSYIQKYILRPNCISVVIKNKKNNGLSVVQCYGSINSKSLRCNCSVGGVDVCSSFLSLGAISKSRYNKNGRSVKFEELDGDTLVKIYLHNKIKNMTKGGIKDEGYHMRMLYDIILPAMEKIKHRSKAEIIYGDEAELKTVMAYIRDKIDKDKKVGFRRTTIHMSI